MPGTAQVKHVSYPIKGPANLEVYVEDLAGETVNAWMGLGRVTGVSLEETRDKDSLTEIVEGASLPLLSERTTQEASLRCTTKEPLNSEIAKMVFGGGDTQENVALAVEAIKELVTLDFTRRQKVKFPYGILSGVYPEIQSPGPVATNYGTGGSIPIGEYYVTIVGVFDEDGNEEGWPHSANSYDNCTVAANELIGVTWPKLDGNKDPMKYRIYLSDVGDGAPAATKNRTLIAEVPNDVFGYVIRNTTGTVTVWPTEPTTTISLTELDGTALVAGDDYSFDTATGEYLGYAAGASTPKENKVYILTYGITRPARMVVKAGPLAGAPTYRKLRLTQVVPDPQGGTYHSARVLVIYKATPDTEGASHAFEEAAWDSVGQDLSFDCLYDGAERAIYELSQEGEIFTDHQAFEAT